jgi:sulfatase maturation enzyme AslB (radical SAM superfamily)
VYNGRGIECHEPHVHRDFIVENNRLSVKPCNIFYEGIDKSTPQQIIEQHSKGIWPSGCMACKHNEKNGVKSRRTQMNEFARNNGIDYRLGVQNVSLRYGTLCNLRCPICDAGRSSAWANELVKHGHEVDAQYIYDKNKMPPITEVLKDIDTHKIKKWHFHGGEPLLADYPWEVLELSGPDAHFHFNTNGSVFPKKLDMFKNKNVEFLFSIDDIGDRFEYLRYPAKFKNVQKNIQKAKDMGFNISVTPTISSINVWYVPEFMPWLVKTFGSRIWSQFVDLPLHYNISHLPQQAKDKVIKKLSKEKFSKFLNPIIDKLSEDKETIDFMPHVKNMDQRRNNSFSATFDEWSEIYADSMYRQPK